MTKRILVVGLGRFGSALAESLAQFGVEVLAVDNEMDEVEAIKHKVAFALALDATDPHALRSVDAQNCSAAVVAVGENFEGAVLAVAVLRELGVPLIVARARSTRHGRILIAAGANRVIEIESEMGRALGRELAGGADLAAQAAAAIMATATRPPSSGSGGPPPGYPG